MRTRRPKIHQFLSDVTSTGAGTEMFVSNYRHITVLISTENSANLTVKCKGSVSTTGHGVNPVTDWTAAASVSNPYSAIGMYDYEDATLKDGDTGIVLTGTDDVIILTVNTDGLDFINFDVTAYTAGNLNVSAVAYTNV